MKRLITLLAVAAVVAELVSTTSPAGAWRLARGSGCDATTKGTIPPPPLHD
jgi:hypothetical protein